jgi:hypothetical protein
LLHLAAIEVVVQMKCSVLRLISGTRGSAQLKSSTEVRKPMAKNRFREIKLLVASTMLLSAVAHAGFSITGTVTWLEVWRTGNVDFQLSTDY